MKETTNTANTANTVKDNTANTVKDNTANTVKDNTVNTVKDNLVSLQTNVVAELDTVKLSIDNLNRLSEIKSLIKGLKQEQKSTMSRLFNRLSDLTKLDIKGLESLTNNQKRVLLLNEIEVNLEDEYSIKIFGLIKWYYNSRLSIKKEFVTLKNLRSLKKLVKYYTKSSVNALVKSKSIVTKADYNQALDSVISNALSLETLVRNAKKHKNLKDEMVSGVTYDGKVSYDIPQIDYEEVDRYNKECYILELNNAIKEA